MELLEQANNAMLLSTLAGKSAADELMARFGGLTSLAQASFDELQKVKGIGKSKAAAIKSAFLLAQRLSQESWAEAPILENPEQVANLLREANRVYTVETFQTVFLNARQRLIGVENVSQGTLNTVLVHAREVFAAAISKRAFAIVLAHNHPSGDPTPSDADIRLTRDLARAGQLLKIEVMDHIILGRRTDERPRDYVSLKEMGYLFTNTSTTA